MKKARCIHRAFLRLLARTLDLAQVDGGNGDARDGDLAGGAFALAADDFEEVGLAPVGVHLEVVRHRAYPLELFERLFEVLGTDAVDEVDERLGRRETVPLVDLENLVYRDVGFLGEDAGDTGGEVGLALVAGAADEDVVAGNLELVDAVRGALEADAAHVVVAA